MWEELKQNLKQKGRELSINFHSRTKNLKEKYIKRFPKPELDKPTDHLLANNSDGITIESNKTTRLILKFWLM